MEVEEQWYFKAIDGNVCTPNKGISLSSILQYFDDTEAETVSEWITSIPKDAVLVLDSVNGNPLYKGRCFTSYNAKERSISSKALVISGESVPLIY